MARIVPGIPANVMIEGPTQARKVRAPVHDFNLRHRPFVLQPSFLAPVLPGDTLKNCMISYSAMTDPIKNPLIGWWLDHHVFYVPFRAMDVSTELQAMVLDPAFGELGAGADTGAWMDFYHATATKPSFGKWAVKAVVEEYFRNEGEDYLTSASLTSVTTASMPQIGLRKKNALSSFVLDSDATEPDVLPGTGDSDDHLDELLGGSLGTTFAGSYDAYQALVAAGVVDITYEDWLAQYGVRLPTPDNDPKPQRILSNSDWKFPSKAIDENDGSIAAAVHWRDRCSTPPGTKGKPYGKRFKEPGVLLGLTCATPKVYLGNQAEAVVDHLTRSLDWLPAVLGEHAFTSLKLFTDIAGGGPLGAVASGDYWLDIRDLFVHGDQLVNFALTETDSNIVALPNASGKSRFVSSTDADNLFSAASPANQIRQEGRARLSFLSMVTDMTPNLS